MTTHAQARELFENGDIVFVSGGAKTWLRRLICWATNGPHYHVGIAFWAITAGRKNLLIAEAQPDGYRVIDMHYYNDRDLTVFRCPVPWKNISERVLASTGTVPYDFIDLAMIGLHEKFGMAIPPFFTGPGEVCSAMVSKLLQFGGLKGLDTMVSPQRLCQQLRALRWPAFHVVA